MMFTDYMKSRIPRQDKLRDITLAFAGDPSITSWHNLPEHRPLGSINRARRMVYHAISEFRHDNNAAPRPERAELPNELAN